MLARPANIPSPRPGIPSPQQHGGQALACPAWLPRRPALPRGLPAARAPAARAAAVQPLARASTRLAAPPGRPPVAWAAAGTAARRRRRSCRCWSRRAGRRGGRRAAAAVTPRPPAPAAPSGCSPRQGCPHSLPLLPQAPPALLLARAADPPMRRRWRRRRPRVRRPRRRRRARQRLPLPRFRPAAGPDCLQTRQGGGPPPQPGPSPPC